MHDYLTLVQPWEPGDSTEAARTRVFSLHLRRYASAIDPARAGEFACLRCPDWVNVIALTARREVVLIEQFRFGLGQVTLEIPGGIADDGELPAETCRRELREETGYDGDPVEMIGSVSANPAIQDNRVHTGLVRNARPLVRPSLDAHEEIGVRLVPLDDIPDLIRAGIIHHAFVVAAFHMLHLRGEGP